MPHIHQVQLPDGTIVPTGVDEEIAVEGAPPDTAEAEMGIPKGLKAEREYIRDENGRFASEGAAGAVNETQKAGERLERAAARVDREGLGQRGMDNAVLADAQAGVEDAMELARESGDTEAASQLNAINRRLVDAESGRDLQRAARDTMRVRDEMLARARQSGEVGEDEGGASEPRTTMGGTPLNRGSRVQPGDTPESGARGPRRRQRADWGNKGDFDDCFNSVMSRPGFEPDDGRSAEESARAICATKPGGPAAGGKRDVRKGDGMSELDQARTAYRNRSVDGLPSYGRSVYDSMYRSTFQMFGKADDPASQRYADGIAWRAVAQAYHLESEAQKLAPRASASKAIPASQLADSTGGFYIVPISKYRGAESFYDRTEFREIPDSGGAIVHVGIGRPQNHKNIIDVRVPKRVVDSTPGGSGAISWVQNNWAYIFNIAKADISPGGMIRNAIVKQHGSPRARIRVEGCKFFSTPAEASQRITYDVVYPAWQVDLQGQYATADEVRKMAHDFMANGGGTNLMHITGLKMSDGSPAGVPVESYVAGEGDPRFPRDSWVMGVRWHPEAWAKIKSGELRGYSIEGQWGVIPLHAGA